MLEKRIIMHIDLDAFFASVEEREHPEYRGKPLIVGAGPIEGLKRGVVSTANYEARKFGIHSAMPISIAHKKCPEGIFIPANHELYEKVSQSIMLRLKKYADKTEQYSIDEMFLDVSDKTKNFKQAEEIAKKIKNEIKENEQLTCSIGISSNKLVAKIASDFKKPAGLTIVPQNKIQEFLDPLSPRKLIGVGPKTETRLKDMGIETIKKLRAASKEKLVDAFGVHGEEMYSMARGIDNSPVEEYTEIKSHNRNYTFQEDTKEKELLMKTLAIMASEIENELKKEKMFYKTITVRCRYSNFDTHIKSKTIKLPVSDTETMLKVAEELLDEFLKDERKIRQIGLRVSNLTNKKIEQQKLT
ncbi:TPA: DNA polymerase IV [archaeon]|uniref:DNA polymerase IV n=1 Tax=Candidatus Naiadarchaeum limnaeum TaxID=2756139 RepID=A0A832XI42_9ARCH|nr:DNA polymerase IV [Candidatus Naiadarchaeales archaeon SRR2090153.bin1042]HIK00246.1 DNA polymerase IV [Candidatus Naiadarchaeum limnaeum]